MVETQKDTNGIGSLLKFVVEAPFKAVGQSFHLGSNIGHGLAGLIDPESAAKRKANEANGKTADGRPVRDEGSVTNTMIDSTMKKITGGLENLADFSTQLNRNMDASDARNNQALTNTQGRSVAPTLNKASNDLQTVQNQNQNAIQTTNQTSKTNESQASL